MILRGYSNLTGVLGLKSGLHIGTGADPGKGQPLPIMVSPRSGQPYVPGSSLKGKMRCLLELTYDRPRTDPRDPGSPCQCGVCQICLLFGSGSAATTREPTRLIFRDCFLTTPSTELLEKIQLEEKPGVRIDRVTGKAAKGALFPMERVPEGCEFKLEISVRLFENDEADAVRKWLAMGLFLMEKDALGGGGTRGSGYIEFNKIQFDEKAFVDKWRDECEKTKDSLKKEVQIKKKS